LNETNVSRQYGEARVEERKSGYYRGIDQRISRMF
jgi:hypothetical protein